MPAEVEEKTKKSKNKKKEGKAKTKDNGQSPENEVYKGEGDEGIDEETVNPFDVAAGDAEAAFVKLLKNKNTDQDTVVAIANWLDAWVPTAGLKRLARLLRAQKG